MWAGPQDLLSVVLTVWFRLLEVGALKADNYRGCSSWIDNTPIDLNAQDPKIRQQDFLQMKEDENACRWDVLSLSLVLNFVPDPRERGMKVLLAQILSTSDMCLGRMLQLAHLFLDASRAHTGYLFVTVRAVQLSTGELATDDLVQLPLPCVQNSRYLTLEHFEDLMKCVGFEKVKERWRVGGKMGYWLFRKANTVCLEEHAYGHKSVLRLGRTRNNFAILL